VILHDFLDDGETQARPSDSSRHIRFGQPLAALLRQALTVVFDDNRRLPVLFDDRHPNLSGRSSLTFGGSRLDRFNCVLDDIDQRLTDEPSIATDRHRKLREDSLEADLGMGGALQKRCLSNDLGKIFGLQHRGRHPCEGGKFVDHATNIGDVPNNRIGADRKALGVALDLLQIPPPQPLRCELDRGQRILDLMRDPASDVSPGCLALGRQELGNIIESHDEADDVGAVVLGRNADEQGAGAVAAGELQLGLRQPVGAALRFVQ